MKHEKSIIIQQSLINEGIELVIVDGIPLGFIHEVGGNWDLETLDEFWDIDDCYETTRQGIITWIRKNVTYGKMSNARTEMQEADDSAEVATNRAEQRRKQAA